MIDFNDMYLFSKVVEHGGISGAAKALGMVHSRISRRIKALETSLDAQLIQRSTRYFAVTELGKRFNEHCLNMVAEANAAVERVEQARERPAGHIRMNCETMLAQFVIGPLLPLFMQSNPGVSIALDTTEREFSLGDNLDLLIRIRIIPCEDSSLIVRPLGIFQAVLVASPKLFESRDRPAMIDDLGRLPSLSYALPQGPHVWNLIDPEKKEVKVRHEPVLTAHDYVVLRHAVLQGVGVAHMPLSLCLDDIREGRLEVVLPSYSSPVSELQAVFASRRGMLPTVRSLIDFLGAHCVGDLEQSQISQHLGSGRHGTTRLWASRQPISDLVG